MKKIFRVLIAFFDRGAVSTMRLMRCILMPKKVSWVRRTYLCGEDFQSGQNVDHRNIWLVERIKFLISAFAVDVYAYARISSHYHNVRVYLLWFGRIVV